ncbi:MAG: SprT-like domain-containing protein [Phycisphaeraceae bacterium]|nr:SprT-like domain-containing protein [Phycisphaeraceae bacterium]
MDVEDARRLARDLMDEHGLAEWSIEMGRAKRTLGLCDERKQLIRLSALYVSLNDRAHVQDTILHEIAHALVGVRHGHGKKWQAACERIGADPTRVDRTATMPAPPYELFCPGCRRVIGRRHRRVRRDVMVRMGCRRCGRGSYGRIVLRPRTGPPERTKKDPAETGPSCESG